MNDDWFDNLPDGDYSSDDLLDMYFVAQQLDDDDAGDL